MRLIDESDDGQRTSAAKSNGDQIGSFSKEQQQQQQQPFYDPLIQDNLREPVPETVGHINPAIITILHSPQYL